MTTGQATLRRAALLWPPLAVGATFLCGLVYAAMQQDLRRGADDPQVTMAEDAAARLDAGTAPSALPPATVDLARGLAPYLIIFDERGRPVASDAVLAGSTPVPPSGVFEAVRAGGEDRITWQPASGVRSAIVVTSYRGGFVLAGRSLRLVEQRESDVEAIVAIIWLATLAAVALASLGADWLCPQGRPAPA